MGAGLVTEPPHLMKKTVRQPDLQAFRFNAVIEKRQQIGNCLVRPVGGLGKPELRLSQGVLPGLLHQILHIPFKDTNDMA